MPGLVLHDRRWGLGSDDCIVPATLLSLTHVVWIIVLIPVIIIAFTSPHITPDNSLSDIEVHYRGLLLVYLSVYVLSLVIQVSIIIVSLKGSVIEDSPRKNIRPLIYIKQGLMLCEVILVSLSAKWLSDKGPELSTSMSSVVAGLIITNTVIFILIILLSWCAWDTAGKDWVKLKKFQENSQRTGLERERLAHNGSKKSGSGFAPRNWRHRKVRRAYENSWDQRCRMFFCCSVASNSKIKSSFAEIARLLSEFFRDLDVVPSDVLAGLILLRQRQQAARQHIISQPTNNVYDFLSGVKVTNDTKFIALDNPSELSVLLDTVHYMHYAMAAYGWPMYVYSKSPNMAISICNLCCCPPCCCSQNNSGVIVDDNCCNCNLNAMKKVLRGKQVEVVWGTCHVDVGETPFFISVDMTKKVIVITIRGTLSMKDIITDLNAECELIPLQNINHEWKGHKGMVQSAEYIYNKLKSEDLLSLAYNHDREAGTHKFSLVCTGHSLGGGTAAILAILLRDRQYPDVTCYSFSPPGGLLSEAAMLGSQSFITSVVVGKDIVPRIGLHQLEILRHQLQQTLHQTKQAKWVTISSSFPCCHPNFEEDSSSSPILPVTKSQSVLHQPLYPPGKIIHIVRQWRRSGKSRSSEPAYQGVWADNKDFDQVLISKRMLQDHMPDNVLDALEKASQVHAWHSAVNTVNITRNKTVEHASKNKDKEVLALSIGIETSKTFTLETVCQSESGIVSDKFFSTNEEISYGTNGENISGEEQNDCDSSANINKSNSVQDLAQQSSPLKVFDKNKQFLESLQNCDKTLVEAKTSSSYVFTKTNTEISQTNFINETKFLSQEISSFYDISNTSTV